MRLSIVEELKVQVEAEGFSPDTREFNERLTALKVAKCQQLRSVPSCAVCSWREDCTLARDFDQIKRKQHG